MRELTDGRGPHAVIDAVGMEAHGAPIGRLAHRMAALLPDTVAQKVIQKAGIDRLSALHLAIDLVRRGGTVSLSGVYGGAIDPMPLIQMFDKQLTFRMGQANVRRWVDDLMPLVTGDDDPLGVETLRDAPRAARRRRRAPTRCSRRRRTARSRCCSSLSDPDAGEELASCARARRCRQASGGVGKSRCSRRPSSSSVSASVAL